MDSTGSANWVVEIDGEKANEYLPRILEYASANYERHTNWFLRHQDTGIKSQALVLAAEFAIVSLSLSVFSSRPDLRWLPCLTLAMAALFSFVLALASHRSCRKSFAASLESAALVTKCIWAMGGADRVVVEKLPQKGVPVWDDEMLYVTRYWESTRLHKRTGKPVPTTGEFVRLHLDEDRTTTCFLGNLTIWLFCAFALLGAVAGWIAICGI